MSYLSWITGVGVPTLIGLGLIVASIVVYINLRTYLPLIAKGLSLILLVAGCSAVGYGQGADSMRNTAQLQIAKAQADALKTALDRLDGSIRAANTLQTETATLASVLQAEAASGKGQVDELVELLKQAPASAGCAWSDAERRRMLGIPVLRAPPSGPGADGPAR